MTIVAGCGIHCGGDDTTEHDGIHTFHIGKNAKVKYVEKHYGEGEGTGDRILSLIHEVCHRETSRSTQADDSGLTEKEAECKRFPEVGDIENTVSYDNIRDMHGLSKARVKASKSEGWRKQLGITKTARYGLRRKGK